MYDSGKWHLKRVQLASREQDRHVTEFSINLNSQVAKANGKNKKNVWEIIQCPEYVLKCNRSAYLPACRCLLDDLVAI